MLQHLPRRLAGAVALACALGGLVTGSAFADNYVALGDSYSSGTARATTR